MSAQELPATVAPGTSPESTSRPAPSDARPQRPADTHLRLRGLTQDGTRLLLVDGSGLEFTVDVDARLRAALHGDPSLSDPSSQSTPTRSGQTHTTNREKTMESILLRPRDIQARIRAGETPEAVAEAAQTTLEKVMPYAAPVLAEREHVAQRALRASIRRPAGDQRQGPSGGRTLGESVSSRLRGMNVDPDSVVWDAWRREDGRWTLTASFSAGGQDGLAQLTFDQPGNFVLLDNDEARWLVGDPVEAAAPADVTPEAAAEPEQTGRLLSAVPSEQLALTPDELGADAIDLVREPAPDRDEGLAVAQPIEAYLDVQATEATTTEIEPVVEEPAAEPAAHEPPARPPVKKKRSSVPSWDEIMFGGPGKE